VACPELVEGVEPPAVSPSNRQAAKGAQPNTPSRAGLPLASSQREQKRSRPGFIPLREMCLKAITVNLMILAASP